MAELISETIPHIFWLMGWNNKRVYSASLFKPKYTLCRIERNSINIECNPTPVTIPMSHILTCVIDTFDQGGTSASTCNVKITLKKDDNDYASEGELFMLVANPLRKLGYHDSNNMVEVINDYLEGRVPLIPVNPYFRELTHIAKTDDFSEEQWNPIIPPDSLIPSPNLFRLFVRIILAIIVAILTVMLVIGLIYNLFT